MNISMDGIDKIQINTTENPNTREMTFGDNSTVRDVTTPVSITNKTSFATTPTTTPTTPIHDWKWFDDYTQELIIFNVVMFALLPLPFILIRLKNKNIPKIELYGAWASILWYAQMIFYFTLYGQHLADYYKYTEFHHRSNFAEKLVETLYHGMLKDLGMFLIFIIPINIFVVTPGVLANLFCCWFCILNNLDDSEENVRTLIRNLEDTGPTMVRARMRKRGETKDWSFLVKDIEQFVYKVWKNDSISGVDEMEEVLENGKIPLKIKFELEVKPEDEKTEIEYLDWCWDFPILEEIVTTPEHLKLKSKTINETIPSIQIPYLASNRHTKPLGDLPRDTWYTGSANRSNERLYIESYLKVFASNISYF